MDNLGRLRAGAGFLVRCRSDQQLQQRCRQEAQGASGLPVGSEDGGCHQCAFAMSAPTEPLWKRWLDSC